MSTDLTPSQGNTPFDEIRNKTSEGREYWSARDLMLPLGYDSWRRFADAVGRAKAAARNSGHDTTRHFAGAVKVAASGPNAEDFHLSRYACYLVAMNGDPRKPEIAAAQTYFAIKTREAEIAAPAPMSEEELIHRALEVSARRVAELTQKVAEQDAKIEADAPKVNYVELYVADTDLLTIRTVAANNDVSEQWLRDLLVDKEWIYVQTERRWSNTKECMEIRRRYSAYAHKRSYFRPVEVHEAPRFKGEVMHTLKVTPAGAEAMARLIKRSISDKALEQSHANG